MLKLATPKSLLFFVVKVTGPLMPSAKAEIKFQSENVSLFPDLIMSTLGKVFCKTKQSQKVFQSFSLIAPLSLCHFYVEQYKERQCKSNNPFNYHGLLLFQDLGPVIQNYANSLFLTLVFSFIQQERKVLDKEIKLHLLNQAEKDRLRKTTFIHLINQTENK